MVITYKHAIVDKEKDNFTALVSEIRDNYVTSIHHILITIFMSENGLLKGGPNRHLQFDRIIIIIQRRERREIAYVASFHLQCIQVT